MTAPPTIRHDPAAARFSAEFDSLEAELTYRIADGVMTLQHTGVPGPLEGRGIAAALVRTALAHARAQGLRVRPACSYVRVYLRRHPHEQDLLE